MMFPNHKPLAFTINKDSPFAAFSDSNLVIPMASKKMPNMFPNPPPTTVTRSPSKPNRSEILWSSELELVEIINLERSLNTKKMETLFETSNKNIVPCLMKPNVKVPIHLYDPNLNYKDMCNFLKISIHKHLSY